MIAASFLVPGDLTTPTGGYAYARHLLAHLPGEAVDVTVTSLPGSFPHPTEADLAATAALLAESPLAAVLLIDGLAYGALPPGVIAAAGARPIVALVHHPLGLEAGLNADEAACLLAAERAALALAARIVVTSCFTRALLIADFGVPADRIAVAEPGTDPAARAVGSGSSGIHLLAIGAVTPRKGFDHLVAALSLIADLEWTLTIVGACDRAPEHVAALRQAIATAGLGSRITLSGTVSPSRLDDLYEHADIVVSSSLFEGFGMALAEALARGLPVVATTGGAAADTVPDSAGLKVAPGDPVALAAALRSLIADPDKRAAAAQSAWKTGQGLTRWSDTAAIVAATLREARP